jgi:Glycosyl transferases group 1
VFTNRSANILYRSPERRSNPSNRGYTLNILTSKNVLPKIEVFQFIDSLVVGGMEQMRCELTIEQKRITQNAVTHYYHAACASLRVRKNVDYRLIMIFGGTLASNLQELVIKLNISSKVAFVEKLTHREFPRWFTAFDTPCLPSYKEDIPNVVMEALAAGLPVAATTVRRIPEVVTEDSGILRVPRAVGNLVKALTQALSRSWNTALIAKSGKSFT